MNVLGFSISRTSEAPSSVTTRTIAVIGTTALLTAVSGTAWAVWSVQGQGVGTAAAGSSTPLTISAASVTGALVPGGTADVQLTITNNNKASASVSSLTLSNSGIVAYTDAALQTTKPTCATTGVSWTSTSKTLTPIVIAPNGGTYTLTLTNMAQMSTSSDDACQGAFFKMPITAVTATLVSAAANNPNSGAQ